MKKNNRILAIILCVSLIFSLSSVFFSAFAQQENGGEAVNEENSADDGKFKMEFHPEGFVEQLGVMGIGMLGIFIIIGLIALATIVINKVFSAKPKNQN